jgi:hypothetical protein
MAKKWQCERIKHSLNMYSFIVKIKNVQIMKHAKELRYLLDAIIAGALLTRVNAIRYE